VEVETPLVMADGSRIWTDRPIAPQAILSSLYGWIAPLWLAGVALASVRLVSAAHYVRSVRRSGAPAPPEVTAAVLRLAAASRVCRRIGVIVTALAESPATIGWLKPVVLLPPALLTGLSLSQIEALLAHEIAHIRRHDYFVNLMQLGAETLLFYHPAVWWVSHRIRVERELCCDDVAVRTSGDAHDYAQALVAVARHTLAAATVGAAGPSLPYRVRRLLTPPGDTPRAGAGSMATVVLVLAVAVSTATWVHGQARSATQNRDLATLSLTVLDPFGQRAPGVFMLFEQGAFQDGELFGHGSTDNEGRYTVSLPAGKYVFSALLDFFPVTEIALAPGEHVEREVRMQLEPMTGAFTVCIDCREGTPPLPATLIQDLQSDRQESVTALTRTAEPAEGWEQFRVDAPASLRRLDRSVAGLVTVTGRVAVDGRLTNLRAVSAHPALSDAALRALEAKRWVPARVRSTLVEVDVLLELQYVWESER
jgi:beta-lactamase regulating signal transducer with metallopeptidase domain